MFPFFAAVNPSSSSSFVVRPHPLPAHPRTTPLARRVVLRSPNAKRMACVTVDRVVQLFDDAGTKRDKFSTKPSDPAGPKTFLVRGLAFSPDSTKLAVAQSDKIVFVYKLGSEWGDKKSICNKFATSNAVTSLTWPRGRHHELVFGTADGKVRTRRVARSTTRYATSSSRRRLCVFRPIESSRL
jgi:intraflagellar transport protein 172